MPRVSIKSFASATENSSYVSTDSSNSIVYSRSLANFSKYGIKP